MLGLGFSGDSRIAPTGGFWRTWVGVFSGDSRIAPTGGFLEENRVGVFRAILESPLQGGVLEKIGVGFFRAILESPLQGGVFGEKSGWGFLGDSRIAPTPKRRGPPERSRRGDTPTSSIAVTHRVLLMVLPPEIFLQRKPL
jgi:hypothetical protein